MLTPSAAQLTAFSKDVLGRYICNGLDEALASIDSSRSPNARMFDVIILGGGSFGSVCAQHLFTQDSTHSHRILVLEGGPFSIPEHVQNLPVFAGLNVPSATSIQDLRSEGQFGPDKPREEVWGIPWHSSTKFPGLAYCLGGRSLYFGGWCPQLLDAEMNSWPQAVRDDLAANYFAQASEQIGTNVTNDFISGPLHDTLRQMLFDGIQAGGVREAIPLNQLPVHPPIRGNIDQLEAPLAVQSATKPGLFPFNKFSAAPLLIRAARAAYSESGGDDFKKRLMIVPRCHVTQLQTENVAVNGQLLKRVNTVLTNDGPIPVPQDGIVIVALGTIESTRLVLLSFGDVANANQFGRNLMAHLRSNVTIRIPRTSLPGNLPQKLMASALFVKGRHRFPDNSIGHFHLQITAAGLGNLGTDSEAELFKKIPDIDNFGAFKSVHDQAVVITIRGIGEMQPGNPANQVCLDPELDESGVHRCFVSLPDPATSTTPQSQKDRELWDAIDQATDQVARIFANGADFEIFTGNAPVRVGADADLRAVFPYTPGRRDGIGTTHHEAGSLAMGTNPAISATNSDCRAHAVSNTYIAGPALFPSLGSPNPMLTGVAVSRRLVDRLVTGGVVPSVQPSVPHAGFQSLFAGTSASFDQWQLAGSGNFSLINGEMIVEPGNDLGLLFLATRTFSDFILRLEFQVGRIDDNSGIFVRFRNPRLPVPDRNLRGVCYPYNNQAFVGVDTGFEIQIDELARGNRVGCDEHRTGAVYGVPIGPTLGQQNYRRGPALVPGQWNTYEIEVRGNTYVVRLNGQQTTRYTNTDLFRGKSQATDPDSGYIGIQSHTGRLKFRNVQVMELLPTLAVGAGPITATERVTPVEYTSFTRDVMGALPPRFLNAAFREVSSNKVVEPDHLLRAGAEYDLLVDVGRRWIKNLVTGHAEFPEYALDPDEYGYEISVLFVSEDFNPKVKTGQLWLPKGIGQSFPVIRGERASEEGPMALRLTAPKVAAGSTALRAAKGRLSLYYRGNLLQSAAVRTTVGLDTTIRPERQNSVDVDFVLTTTFQRLESRFDGRALNLTLNDDGEAGNRIIVMAGPDSGMAQAPPPGWVPYSPQALGKTAAKARTELVNCFFARDAQGNLTQNSAMKSNNGKSKEQFLFDIQALALLGRDLFNMITSQVTVEGDQMKAREWSWALRRVLAQSSTMQVARTGRVEYVFPWALVYDIPLPGPNFMFCQVTDEWDADGLRHNPTARSACPYADRADHQENILCPYGFWGLRHIIEQPPSVLKKKDNTWALTEAVTEILFTNDIQLSVGITRDPQLDSVFINGHIGNLSKIAPLQVCRPGPADDVTQVRSVLQAPAIAYFLCHGKYDAVDKSCYLGIGDPDDKDHKVLPGMVQAWADTSQLPNLAAWPYLRPFIFINGCHTCSLRPEETLQFVSAFTYAEASGVLGTEISVQLPVAAEVGELMLGGLAAGRQVGELLHEVRWKLANKGSMLGLAYTLYAMSGLHLRQSAGWITPASAATAT